MHGGGRARCGGHAPCADPQHAAAWPEYPPLGRGRGPWRRGAGRGHPPGPRRAGPGRQRGHGPAAGGAQAACGAVLHGRRAGAARHRAARADAAGRHLQLQPFFSECHAAPSGVRGDRPGHRARPARRHRASPAASREPATTWC